MNRRATAMSESSEVSPVRTRAWPRRLLIAIILAAALLAVLSWWRRRGPAPPTLIFTGITYGCDRVESSDQGSGLVHWVRVDLTAPGIELYVTPLDPAAQKEGWQFRLRRTG